MIDPGRPFSVNYADIIAALEDRVRNGVEQPDQRTFIYQRTITSYELPPSAYAITRVSGLLQSQFHVFDPGADYTFNANRVVWINQKSHPDDGSRLDVEFTYREVPPGITDFNPGSVVGTLIRAVAREMKLIYEQMDEAYRRAFIDQATGVALDNVVALLGVARKVPVPAIGGVTFFRRTPPPRTIQIPAGTRLADQAGNIFLTTADGTIPPLSPIDEITRHTGGVARTSKVIVELIGVWRAADNPDTAPMLPVKPGFGGDGQTITLDLPAPVLAGIADLRIRYKPASAHIPIVADQPGIGGNVAAGSIVTMPTPPAGVDGVTNELPTQDGEDAESDDPLRERAKHALERAGNATSNAIKFAVLEVKGVEGVEVIDRSIDDAIPLGEVRVRYSGGRVEDVRAAVEQARAAGIIARLEQIVEVTISGTFYLIPSAMAAPPPASIAAFVSNVLAAIQAQAIGAQLQIRRLNSLVFNLAGLADVAEAQLSFSKPDLDHPGGVITGDVTSDPFLIAPTEIIRVDRNRLTAVVLTALQSPGSTSTAPNTFNIDIQLIAAAGQAVTFRRLTLNLAVVIRAYSKTNPDQPPERIASFTTDAPGHVTPQFTNSATATLSIIPADLAGFRAADHRPEIDVLISAAAYAGLQEVTVKLTVS